MRLTSKLTESNEKKDRTLLYGTIALLAIGFFVLVGLVYLFSSSIQLPLGKCVGIVEINQEISTTSIPPSLFAKGIPGSEDIALAVESINKRDDVGAVVFVINSPGGSVVATREIYNSMKELKKPKVSYFREVAASGGYYIATATDYIVSDPDAITGSIGVIATFTDLSGLLEKVGVNVTDITSGEHKGIGSPTKQMTGKEREILQNLINEVYAEFKSAVIEGRSGRLDLNKFEEIADGRILSGRQAKEIGLVDSLGTKKDAIKKAAALAGIEAENPPTCKIKVTPGSSSDGSLGFDSMLQQIFFSEQNQKVQISYK
ncbi:signal peptide peptidase SppA [Candidatus Micrarchaeota archaeon]|nr:signal peptide peptidase SppA [Candidatus Micrarchaeota archaeon]